MSTAKEIQLPSTLETKGQNDTVTCRLCRRQFAKYTCSRCNVPYCSLTCYRSQAHNQCSEAFYKKEIEEDIHAGPSTSLQEKQKMMEMLKKFEEQASEQKLEDEDEEDEDEMFDLAERFGTIDIETVPPDQIWTMLTPEERKKFLRAMDDPSSQLARQLLASEQLEKEIQKPWWEAPSTPSENSNHETSRAEHLDAGGYGHRPAMMEIPTSMIKPIPIGHPLVYNMCAICISYAYITRHLGTSPLGSLDPENIDYKEARRLFSQLVPFLTDRKSTQLYPNVSSVITGIWSLSEPGKMTSDLFALLLRDAAALLRPLKVTEMTTESDDMLSSSHAHCMSVFVLSDVAELFSDVAETEVCHEERARKANHVTHKLRYYAGHILSTPSAVLWTICDEMVARAESYGAQEVAETGSTVI